MYIFKPESAASMKITVTDAATSLYSLMDTAGSSTNSENYYEDLKANALIIRAEDGDVRWLSKVSPTSTAGNLIKSGSSKTITNIDLTGFKLIRTGGTNVTCTVQIGRVESGEGDSDSSEGGSAINVSQLGGNTIDTGLGATSTGTQRVTIGTNTFTYAETTVGDSATSVTLLAANAARGMATIRNGSTSAMYISKTATATTSSPVKLASGAIYELPLERGTGVYKGALTAIWDSDAGGSAYIEESTVS